MKRYTLQIKGNKEVLMGKLEFCPRIGETMILSNEAKQNEHYKIVDVVHDCLFVKDVARHDTVVVLEKK